MYLPLDRMKWVLTELRTHVARLRISFDYMAESVITKTTGEPGITKLVESFANMGAPWLSGVSDIESLAYRARPQPRRELPDRRTPSTAPSGTSDDVADFPLLLRVHGRTVAARAHSRPRRQRACWPSVRHSSRSVRRQRARAGCERNLQAA